MTNNRPRQNAASTEAYNKLKEAGYQPIAGVVLGKKCAEQSISITCQSWHNDEESCVVTIDCFYFDSEGRPFHKGRSNLSYDSVESRVSTFDAFTQNVDQAVERLLSLPKRH